MGKGGKGLTGGRTSESPCKFRFDASDTADHRVIIYSTVPLPGVIRQRDLFEPTVDERSDGKSRCGALNDRRHPLGRKKGDA